jgi:2-C-methyl-D-erythritol 4-phosphate cytidylyltransferase
VGVLAIVPMAPDDAALAQQYLAGRTMLDHVLSALREASRIDDVAVVAASPDAPWSAVADALPVPDAPGVVVVHDPLRPLVPAALIDAVVAALADSGATAALPALPVTDTLKSVADDGCVIATADRTRYESVATPVAVDSAALRAVLDAKITPPADGWRDRAAVLVGLLRRQGFAIATLPGTAETMAVSSPAHLAMAEALLAVRRDQS